VMARIISRPWAEEDDRRLLQLRDQGLSTIKIGVTLKRTTKAVTSRLSILRRRKKTDHAAPSL
jgi:hypothetical protein